MNQDSLRARHILNIRNVSFTENTYGQNFSSLLGPIANRLCARKLGYRMTIVPPGKRAWPFHAHLVNEEMFLILEGSGILRLADAELAVEQGDVIAIPPDRSTPHQLINTGDRDLHYLCVSTMEEPDVVLYPDSEKTAVITGTAPGREDEEQTYMMVMRDGDRVGYWEGEE